VHNSPLIHNAAPTYPQPTERHHIMNRKIHISTAFILTITVAGALLALFY